MITCSRVLGRRRAALLLHLAHCLDIRIGTRALPTYKLRIIGQLSTSTCACYPRLTKGWTGEIVLSCTACTYKQDKRVIAQAAPISSACYRSCQCNTCSWPGSQQRDMSVWHQRQPSCCFLPEQHGFVLSVCPSKNSMWDAAATMCFISP